jgi:hypothetical protein
MRPTKERKPFTLFKTQTKSGPVWYARFWDDVSRRYAARGLPGFWRKAGKRADEAEQAAREMAEGIFPALREKLFSEYLDSFWRTVSPYAREKTLAGKSPLSLS